MGILISRREALNESCPECGEQQWIVKKLINQGGSTTYPYVCGNCGLKTQVCEKKSVVKNLGYVPEEILPKYQRSVCEVCGAEGAQNHHWAPYFIFGEESEKWPKSYLCQSCHEKWHKLVAPNVNNA